MKKPISHFILFVMGAFVLIVAFQNCAPYAAKLEASVTSASSGSGSAIEPSVPATPLPQSPFESSKCLNSGLDFCDDFENGTPSSMWEVVGNPVVDSDQPRRGTKALHIIKTGSGGSGLRLKTIFPAVNNTYYGRAFMKFISIPKAPLGYLHYSIITAAGSDIKTEVRIGGQWQNSKNILHVGSDGGATGDWGMNDKDPVKAVRELPVGEWMCIEWMHKGDTSETQFWWNGVEHPSMATSLTRHGGFNAPFQLPQFNRVFVGWTSYQASDQTYELFVDEVAFHHERIGCDK